MASRVVHRVQFHQSIFALGKNFGNSLPNQSKSFPSLAMRTSPEGVVGNISGQEFLVPWGNIVVADLGAEILETKKPDPEAGKADQVGAGKITAKAKPEPQKA